MTRTAKHPCNPVINVSRKLNSSTKITNSVTILLSYSTTNAQTWINYIEQNHQPGIVMPQKVSATKYVIEHQESPMPTSSNQHKRERGR
jgi:hypothetical protein